MISVWARQRRFVGYLAILPSPGYIITCKPGQAGTEQFISDWMLPWVFGSNFWPSYNINNGSDELTTIKLSVYILLILYIAEPAWNTFYHKPSFSSIICCQHHRLPCFLYKWIFPVNLENILLWTPEAWKYDSSLLIFIIFFLYITLYHYVLFLCSKKDFIQNALHFVENFRFCNPSDFILCNQPLDSS